MSRSPPAQLYAESKPFDTQTLKVSDIHTI
jgi:hypothetical protein